MNRETISVLVIEDDIDINGMLTELLTEHNYQVHSAYSGTEAVMCMEREHFDIVLLDLMLPGMKGEDVLSEAKKIDDTLCVITVSARDDTGSKIALLKAGADDYITKPFDTDELLARIEAVLRRNKKYGVQEKDIVRFREIELNRSTFQVKVKGQEISLTRREFLILELLMSNPSKVFTKNNIFESVWKEEFIGEDNAVNVHISNIRQKLLKICPAESYIQTVWGIGFKMKL